MDFDTVCSCEHETATQICACTRKKDAARSICQRCMDGKHKLVSRESANAPLVTIPSSFSEEEVGLIFLYVHLRFGLDSLQGNPWIKHPTNALLNIMANRLHHCRDDIFGSWLNLKKIGTKLVKRELAVSRRIRYEGGPYGVATFHQITKAGIVFIEPVFNLMLASLRDERQADLIKIEKRGWKDKIAEVAK